MGSQSKVVWEKTCLVLSNNQLAALGELAAAIRRRSGVALNRSALVRAIINGALLSKLPLAECESERQMIELVRDRLNG